MPLQLWYLLVDGERFHETAVEHNYMGFYQEQMKSLATMSVELPRTYKSFRKFIDNNVFGEGEEEVVHPSVEKQREFRRKLNADIEEEKALQKERQDHEEPANSPSTAEAPHLPTKGPTFDVTMTSNLHPTELPHPRITAGCVWDSNNWSCAYDSVFMCFWSIYKRSPLSWRNNWRLHAPNFGNFLGVAFDSLLAMAQNEQIAGVALAQEFNAYREAFQAKLARLDPTYFKLRGKVSISVSPILDRIFGDSVEFQPHLNQVVACDHCNQPTPYQCRFTLLGTIELLSKYLNDNDTAPRLPLQEAVTRFIQHASLEPYCTRCPDCSKPVKNVQSLSIPDMSWLWIEFHGPVSPISPSPHLVFDLQDQHQTYTLQAVIYGGDNHFTARLSDESAAWWKYDGMWKPDVQRLDHIEREADLLMDGNRPAVCLLYCRADFQD